MQTVKIVFFSAVIIYSVIILILAFLSKKPLKTIFLSAGIGVISLALVSLCEKFTGVKIPINLWTVTTSAVMSLPGTITLLAVNFIMG